MFGAELIVETIIGDGGIINEGIGEEGRGLIPETVKKWLYSDNYDSVYMWDISGRGGITMRPV